MVGRRHLGTALATALVTLSLACAAAAAGPPSWSDRQLVLESVTGFGTPVGLFGAIARVEPLPWLSAGGGAGVSIRGPQYSALLLGRLPLRAETNWLSALTLGASYSVGGSYAHDPNPTCWVEDCRDRWVDSVYALAHARWLGVELGAEFRARNGLSLRGFGGLAKLTNPGDATCKNFDRTRNAWLSGPCKVPLADAPSMQSIFPDISGPPGTPDLIWVLGLAVGYAVDITP